MDTHRRPAPTRIGAAEAHSARLAARLAATAAHGLGVAIAFAASTAVLWLVAALAVASAAAEHRMSDQGKSNACEALASVPGSHVGV